GALSAEDRSRAVALTAILRIADALDAAHSSLVGQIWREPAPAGTVTLVASAHGEAELEQWMVRRKQELFERTFGVELHLRVEAVDRAEYDRSRDEIAGLG
ncbi:MAG: hypothetical protein JWM85_591, partial [Acidimicrobiaceae bacterium]|nr:hypothetical protein [Acidimicrobiaceae bacterium]